MRRLQDLMDELTERSVAVVFFVLWWLIVIGLVVGALFGVIRLVGWLW